MPGPATVNLASAAPFGVLGGSTVTNTGASTVFGDLGLSPGSSVTGFPPGIVTGTQHVTDATAAAAQVDLTAAYVDAAGRGGSTPIVGDLGGQTLAPGLYSAAAGQGLTGTLILDAAGDPSSVWIFQIGTALTVAGTVTLANGALAANVFWQIGSSATIGTGSLFAGNIIALTSITLVSGATLNGRALARNGAVTMDSNPGVGLGASPVGSSSVIYEAPLSVQGTSVGPTTAQIGNIRNKVTARIIATSDLNLAVIITHNLGSNAAQLALGNPMVILEPLLSQALTALSRWTVTAKTSSIVTVTKLGSTGSGNAAAQLRIHVLRPSSKVQ